MVVGLVGCVDTIDNLFEGQGDILICFYILFIWFLLHSTKSVQESFHFTSFVAMQAVAASVSEDYLPYNARNIFTIAQNVVRTHLTLSAIHTVY